MSFTEEVIDTVVVGAGQSGIAMSDNLAKRGILHVVLEQDTVANRWRNWRWDSLVANGPAWSNCLPGLIEDRYGPDEFQPKEAVADYLQRYASMIEMPVHTGVKVEDVSRVPGRPLFSVRTSKGTLTARRVVCAAGAYQSPYIPSTGLDGSSLLQLHSVQYRNPEALPAGAVLVVGAGSSGAQIADELCDAGRKVYLSIAAHHRTPRRYRGKDYNWWLGTLGDWDRQTQAHSDHYTVAVSGAKGGRTIDYKEFEQRGMVLVGKVKEASGKVVTFDDNLLRDIEHGDRSYLEFIRRVDEYIETNGFDFPEEPEAQKLLPNSPSVTDPLKTLDLAAENITTIIWATGFTVDYSWLNVPGALTERGYPNHHRGESFAKGIYFVGLPFLTSFGSSFLISVWYDAEMIANIIERHARFEGGEKYMALNNLIERRVRRA